MRKKVKTVLFKITEFALMPLLIRLALIGWLIFASTMFNINPVFFSISIAAAILTICSTREESFLLREDELEIKATSWVSYFNKSTIIYLSDLEDLEIIKDKFKSHSFFGYSNRTHRIKDWFLFRYKDGTTYEHECIGFESERLELVEKIKSKIILEKSSSILL